MIDWNEVSKEEYTVISAIMDRLEKEVGTLDTRISVMMDIAACHITCPLDLTYLLKADFEDFMHDILGIRHNLNRETGKLENGFLPRYVHKEEEVCTP